MRRIFSLLLMTVFIMMLYLPLQTMAEKPIEVMLNGTKISLSTNPIIENDTPFIPFEEMFEKLDFDVFWDDYYEVYDAYSYFTSISFEPGSIEFWIGDEELEFELPSKIINGITYVPLSFIHTVAGKDVKWDKANRIITITDSMLDGNLRSTDAKAIFEKMKSVDIRNATYSASIYMENKEDELMKSFYGFIEEGVTLFNPTITTQLKGTLSYKYLDMDLEVFIQKDQQYRRNFVSGQWLAEDPVFINFDPLVHVINYARSDWEKGITDIKSGLSYDGLNLIITLNPDFYHKYVSPKVTNSPTTEVWVTFYDMDPKTLVPNDIYFVYVEKDKDGFNNHSISSYISINSINEVKQITVPTDLKPLIK